MENEVTEIKDLALEVVVRGIFPHQKDKIEQLAKDADVDVSTVKLQVQRMVAITYYANEIKNEKACRKAQVVYLQQIVVNQNRVLTSLQMEMEEYLPFPEQWAAADERSMKAMKEGRAIESEPTIEPRISIYGMEVPLEEILAQIQPLTDAERERIAQVCENQ